MEEGEVRIFKEETITFELPIRNPREATQVKNMPPSSLPKFNGMESEYSDMFLFEFYVLYRSYDYVLDAHKLKLFPG
jgi:hypothetical protein